jgi:hypothetical protein
MCQGRSKNREGYNEYLSKKMKETDGNKEQKTLGV